MDLNSEVFEYWQESAILYYLTIGKHRPIVSCLERNLGKDYKLVDGKYYLSPVLMRDSIFPFYIPVKISKGRVLFESITAEDIIVSKRVEEVVSGSYAYLIQSLQIHFDELKSISCAIEVCRELVKNISSFNKESDTCYIFSFADLAERVKGESTLSGIDLSNKLFNRNRLYGQESFCHSGQNFVLTAEQKVALSNLLHDDNKISLLDCAYGSGTKTVIKNYISQLWLNSIVKGKKLSDILAFDSYGIVNKGLFSRDLYPWFSESEFNIIFSRSRANGFSITKDKYFKLSNELFGIDSDSVSTVLCKLRKVIIRKVNNLHRGESIRHSLKEAEDSVLTKHSIDGVNIAHSKVAVELASLRKELNEAKVLLSFWQRQIMSLSLYSKKMCARKSFSNKILSKHRNHLLNVIGEKELDGMMVKDVEVFLELKIKSLSSDVNHAERRLKEFDGDKSDLIKISRRYSDWQKTLMLKSSMTEQQKYTAMSMGVYYDLFFMCLWFWVGAHLDDKNKFISHQNKTVFIDDALKCPTFSVYKTLSAATKVILVKRPGDDTCKFISEYIDDSLQEKYNILTDEVDYDEVQFLGVGASSGNVWRYYSEHSFLDTLKLSNSFKYSKKIVSALNTYGINIDSTDSNKDGMVRLYPILGNQKSFVNKDEAFRVLDIAKSIGINKCLSVSLTSKQSEYIDEVSFNKLKSITFEEFRKSSTKYNFVICSLVFDSSSDFKIFETKEFWQELISRSANEVHIVCDKGHLKSNINSYLKSLDVSSLTKRQVRLDHKVLA